MANLVKTNTDDAAVQLIQPLVNIMETDKEVILEAEMPGLSKEDIALELKDDELVIHGKQRAEELPKGYTALYRERCPFEYMRSFVLGDTIDKIKLTHSMKMGY